MRIREQYMMDTIGRCNWVGEITRNAVCKNTNDIYLENKT